MYVELHAASAFSFLRASSLPEDLVARAAEPGYPALALLDRDGVAGAPRFFKAAKKAGIRPIVGAELTLAEGGCLPVLVESREGYRNLCHLIARMKAGVEKGKGALAIGAFEGQVQGRVALPGVETLGRPLITIVSPGCSRPSAPRTWRSTSSAIAGASRRRRTRRSWTWPTLSVSGPWPPTASATRPPAAAPSPTP